MQKNLYCVCALLFAISINSNAQQWSVATNAVDWIDFGTINVEAGVAVSRRVVVDMIVKYNPWTFGANNPETQKQNRQRMIEAGVKIYPWYIYSGWHFDAHAGWKEYNSGGIFSQTTEEGDAFGASIGAGYTLMLHKNLNLEFGAGVWAGAKTYTVYTCPSCGILTEQGTKFFIMPNNITVGVSWIFDSKKNKQARAEK